MSRNDTVKNKIDSTFLYSTENFSHTHSYTCVLIILLENFTLQKKGYHKGADLSETNKYRVTPAHGKGQLLFICRRENWTSGVCSVLAGWEPDFLGKLST